MWDEHQFTVNQNGEHTLVGVPNFGLVLDMMALKSAIMMVHGLPILHVK